MSIPSRIRKRLPLAGYAVLAIATGFTLAAERQHSSQQRQDLANQTRTILTKSCQRDNNLRTTLQGIILTSIKQIDQSVKDGTITQAQADRYIAQSKDSAKKVAPLNCVKLYPGPKTK
jgi:uncharacterized protein HemX